MASGPFSEDPPSNDAGAEPHPTKPWDVAVKHLAPLLEAEKKVLEAALEGDLAVFGDRRPKRYSAKKRIRSEFLRCILISREFSEKIHPRGVAINGAYLTGELNLEGCTGSVGLYLGECTVNGRITLRYATLPSLVFGDTSFRGIWGDGVNISGDVFFRDGCTSCASVAFPGAVIGGDIEFDGVFKSKRKREPAVDLRGTKIGGHVFFSERFRGDNFVELNGITAHGNIACGGTYKGKEYALIAESASSDRDLVLSGNYLGGATIAQAELKGDVICHGAEFIAGGDRALMAQSVRSGGLVWRNVKSVSGIVDLTMARTNALVDAWASWAKVTDVWLDGFHYDRIAGDSPKSAEVRIQWLKKNSLDEFLPGPWEHAAKVFKEMGHFEDAKLILIEKERQLRKRGAVGGRRVVVSPGSIRYWISLAWVTTANRASNGLHWVYGALAGYGYRPIKTVGWMVASWLVGWSIYTAAASGGMFGPTNARIYTDAGTKICGSGRDPGHEPWTTCSALPAEYPRFSPLIYSLDLSLPVVDLHQEEEWAPLLRTKRGSPLSVSYLLRGFMWIQIVFGWLTSLLLVSALGRLIQKD